MSVIVHTGVNNHTNRMDKIRLVGANMCLGQSDCIGMGLCLFDLEYEGAKVIGDWMTTILCP